jgi:hypothetical protein
MKHLSRGPIKRALTVFLLIAARPHVASEEAPTELGPRLRLRRVRAALAAASNLPLPPRRQASGGIGMTKWRLAAFVVAVGGLLTAPGLANATGTLDQSQTSTGGLEVSVWGPEWVAQTFTAGITGDLDQVDLFLFRADNPGPLTVDIQAVTAGVPSGSVIASSSVAQADVNDSFTPTWISVPFSSPARVNAGKQYAIVLSARSISSFLEGIYAWNDVFGNPYSAGRVVISTTGGATWGDFASVFDDADAAFKTYVTPLPTSIPQCLDGGWESFPQFKNEGDCVSFVATGGRSQPTG